MADYPFTVPLEENSNKPTPRENLVPERATVTGQPPTQVMVPLPLMIPNPTPGPTPKPFTVPITASPNPIPRPPFALSAANKVTP
jgi:hypothetical protein